LSPKVRAFVDWVAELFAACPLLSGRSEGDGGKECNFAGKPGTNTIRTMLNRENSAELY
jgi:LysR family transcriptional regulator for bpeEF and oprC